MTSGQVEREDGQGRQAGPVSLGAAVSCRRREAPDAAGDKPDAAASPETRIVAIGDSDFASNGWLGIPGNRDLFMNSVNWLAQQENMISIRPRDPEDRRITRDRRRRSGTSSG